MKRTSNGGGLRRSSGLGVAMGKEIAPAGRRQLCMEVQASGNSSSMSSSATGTTTSDAFRLLSKLRHQKIIQLGARLNPKLSMTNNKWIVMKRLRSKKPG